VVEICNICLAGFFASCARNKGNSNTLGTLDSNAANKPPSGLSDDIIVDTFTKTPGNIEGCRGIFVRNEDSLAIEPYVFVSNLKGLAFIRINERSMEVRLVRQTNTDRISINELYANEEVEIGLRIKQNQDHGAEVWDYKGVLIVRKKAFRKVVQVSGKVGC
jgi:hypothetical protein